MEQVFAQHQLAGGDFAVLAHRRAHRRCTALANARHLTSGLGDEERRQLAALLSKLLHSLE